MDVATILAQKGDKVYTVASSANLLMAAHKMRFANVGALVVSDDDVQIDGILSEREVVRALTDDGAEALRESVPKYMTPSVRTCKVDDTVTHLMSEMTRYRTRHMPVVDDDGKLCGLVSIGDVVKIRLDELQLETSVLRDVYGTRHDE